MPVKKRTSNKLGEEQQIEKQKQRQTDDATSSKDYEVNTSNESSETAEKIDNSSSPDSVQIEDEINEDLDTRNEEQKIDPVHFSLRFSQSVMACGSCGIIFSSEGNQERKPKLVIEYSVSGQQKTLEIQEGLNGAQNGYSMSEGGNQKFSLKEHTMLIKQTGAYGYYYADIGELPVNAQVNKATLYLNLDHSEGLANSDKTSVLDVHEYSKAWSFSNTFQGGQAGDLIRKISAADDFWGQGISKANPWGGYDFTAFVKKLLSNR